MSEIQNGSSADSVAVGADRHGDALRIVTFAFHIHAWKQKVFERYFPERAFVFVPPHLTGNEFADQWADRIRRSTGCEIFVWSLNAPKLLIEMAERHDIPMYFIEDGFIRSVQPSASRTAPLSLALDRGTAYFDSRAPSDLETLLKTYDFEAAPDLLARASAGIRFLLENGVSKYNGRSTATAEAIYGRKIRRRILVIGQVEDDASIQFGCATPFSNNDLVRLAVRENPEADVIYKPHPDILNRVRIAQSDPKDVRDICRIIDTPMSMAQAFETIDHVYTITSLAGFEALLRGLPVTAYGCPFYAGWGLTDDRQLNPRRGRILTIEALFAAAYLLYPRYFDPETGDSATFEDTVERIARYFRDPQAAAVEAQNTGPRWAINGPYGILGWRHLLTPIVSLFISRIGNPLDIKSYREDPVNFFRELSNPKFRKIGRLLYPRDR